MRADVFAAFSTLLRQTRVGSSHHGLIVAGSDSGASREEEPAVAMLKKQVQNDLQTSTDSLMCVYRLSKIFKKSFLNEEEDDVAGQSLLYNNWLH